MNAKVGFKEVQNYAQTHNVDFKTAAKKLGLSEKEAAELQTLGGDPGAPVDGFVRKQKADSQQKQQEKSWWDKTCDFVKENAAPIIAGTAFVAGAVCCATGVGAGVGVPLMLIGGGMTLASCSTEDDEPPFGDINNTNNATVNITMNQSALIAAFNEGIDALLKKMDELKISVQEYGDQIISLITQNSTYLKGIAEDMKKNNEDNERIIEILTNMNSTVDTISSLIESTNENVVVNGESVKAQLTEILNAIKNGNANTEAKLDDYMNKLKALLENIIKQQGDQIEISKDSNTTLNDILNKLNNFNGPTDEKLALILEVLGSIESIGKEINDKLDVVIGKMEMEFPDNSDIKASLDKIEQYLEQNNAKTDVTNSLLEQLLDKYQAGGLSEADLQKILDAISKNGDKIDTTNKLLTQIGADAAVHYAGILDAIKNISVTGGDTSNIEALLDKILEKMDGNTAKILEAISTLVDKYQAGGLSEADLQKILDAISKNGDKIDVTNQLLTNMQKQDAEFQAAVLKAISELGIDVADNLNTILKAINNINVGGGDSSNIEALLEKVLEKLDQMDQNQQASAKDIIDAIANIKVTGGGVVDLSSIEDMLAELIDLTKSNGSALSDINAKLDVLNVTADAILNKIEDEFGKNDTRYTNVMNMLEAIKNKEVSGGSSYDDSALLAKLDTMLTKLDDILAAIKDHNVTVDVTGKVTCECNCGQNHEGIIGDLEDILG